MKLVVVLLVAVVSAVSWWPVTLEPSLDLPWAVPLVVIAICCCAATALFKDRWLRFVGIASGSIWPDYWWGLGCGRLKMESHNRMRESLPLSPHSPSLSSLLSRARQDEGYRSQT